MKSAAIGFAVRTADLVLLRRAWLLTPGPSAPSGGASGLRSCGRRAANTPAPVRFFMGRGTRHRRFCLGAYQGCVLPSPEARRKATTLTTTFGRCLAVSPAPCRAAGRRLSPGARAARSAGRAQPFRDDVRPGLLLIREFQRRGHRRAPFLPASTVAWKDRKQQFFDEFRLLPRDQGERELAAGKR